MDTDRGQQSKTNRQPWGKTDKLTENLKAR